MRKSALILGLSLPLAVAIAVLAIPGLDHTTGPVQAQAPGGMEALSIDMDPASAPANTATSLGSRQNCARINENDILDADEDRTADTVTLDVTATNIPASHPIIAFGYTLSYDEANLTVQGQDGKFLLASGGANSSVLNASDLTPDTDGNNRWIGSAADTNAGLAGNVAESGSGVLSRLALSSDAGAAAGLHNLTLVDAGHVDPKGDSWAALALNGAQVAINTACGTAPIATPATPQASPTSSPGGTPGGTAAPASRTPEVPTGTATNTAGGSGNGGGSDGLLIALIAVLAALGLAAAAGGAWALYRRRRAAP